MYVLKTGFDSYATGVVNDTGRLENDSVRLADAMTWKKVSDLVAFLRSLPAVAERDQNTLTICRVEMSVPAEPVLVNMGPVG